MTPCLIGIAGSAGSGKTSLIERLAPMLKDRGFRIGVVKHAHDRLDLDRPGKDSWRYLKAGAEVAAVVGPRQLMVMITASGGNPFHEALSALPPGLDLVFVAACPKILVAGRDGKVRGGAARRRFRTGEIRRMAAWIEKEWMTRWETSYRPRRAIGRRPQQAASSAEG